MLKSNNPTVEAFCIRTFSAFQSLFMKLFSIKKLFNSSKIYFPLLSSKADSPIIIIGFLADKSFLENSCSLFIIFFISSVLLPII